MLEISNQVYFNEKFNYENVNKSNSSMKLVDFIIFQISTADYSGSYSVYVTTLLLYRGQLKDQMLFHVQ